MSNGSQGRAKPMPKVRSVAEAVERECKQVDINHLPDEILLQIFSHCSCNELLDVLQNVCWRWKRLTHDPVLWLEKKCVVTASLYQVQDCLGPPSASHMLCRCVKSDEEALKIAPKMPQLRNLTLMRCLDARVLRRICSRWPNLRYLKIDCNQKMNYTLMKYIFDVCPKIEKLRIGASTLAVLQCAELLSSLQHLSYVKVFDDLYNPGPIQLRVLADGCPQLKHISFACNAAMLTLEDMEYFLRAKKDTLVSATLPWMMMEMKCVIPKLKLCESTLSRLHLYCFTVPAELESGAFEALGQLHNLQELHISLYHSQQPQVISLAFRPGCLTQLRKLQMTSASMYDETAICIARGCPNLRELKLSNQPDITDRALSELYRLKHLEILEFLSCNDLGGQSIAHIAQVPSLTRLAFQQMKDLSRLLPSLQQIVTMKNLQSLDFVKSNHNVVVPFDEFPGNLVNLRELRVSYEGELKGMYTTREHNMPENYFIELKRKMPHLKVYNTFREMRDCLRCW